MVSLSQAQVAVCSLRSDDIPTGLRNVRAPPSLRLNCGLGVETESEPQDIIIGRCMLRHGAKVSSSAADDQPHMFGKPRTDSNCKLVSQACFTKQQEIRAMLPRSTYACCAEAITKRPPTGLFPAAAVTGICWL